MNYNFFELTVAIIIRTLMPVEQLNNHLDLNFKIAPRRTEMSYKDKLLNTYVLKHKFTQCQNIDNALKQFWELYSITPQVITLMKTYGDCKIRLFFQSDYAQLAFSFAAQDLIQISKFNLPLEISVLSWGGVDNS